MRAAPRTSRAGRAFVASALVAIGLVSGCGRVPGPAPTVDLPVAVPVVEIELPWWHRTATASGDSGPIDTTITVSGDVLFGPDSAHLTAAAASQLGVALDHLQRHPQARLSIACHSDHGQGGTTARPLSEHRAVALASWFRSEDVAAERIDAAGYGDTRPLAPSDTPEHRAQNRRCELHTTVN